MTQMPNFINNKIMTLDGVTDIFRDLYSSLDIRGYANNVSRDSGNFVVGQSIDVTGAFNLSIGSNHNINGSYNSCFGDNCLIQGKYIYAFGRDLNIPYSNLRTKPLFVVGFHNKPIAPDCAFCIADGPKDHLLTVSYNGELTLRDGLLNLPLREIVHFNLDDSEKTIDLPYPGVYWGLCWNDDQGQYETFYAIVPKCDILINNTIVVGSVSRYNQDEHSQINYPILFSTSNGTPQLQLNDAFQRGFISCYCIRKLGEWNS